jgi:hypothetical protein
MTDPITRPRKYLAPSEEWRDLGASETKQTDEQRKAQDRLKESLLASLQMQNLIVLAGSGTSVAVGGPSMKDLWDAAVGKPPTAAASKVAGLIKYDLKTPNPNIEDFLSRCDAYLQVSDDADVKRLVDACKKVIIEKCTAFLDVKKLDGHKTFLHRLSRRRIRDPRLKLFTTNYDLCFERAAGDLGLVVIDGFSFAQPRYHDPRFFGYDIVRRLHGGEDQGNYLEGVFHLCKLHGSVNWARVDSGSVIEKISPLPAEACLIYPAKGKYQQSFLQPHLELVSQYFAALRDPNTCVIVTGYGFNDDHLSEPILSAVRSNPHLRLIIADLSAEELADGKGTRSVYWKEFRQLCMKGEDVWFINASFSDFAALIPDLKSLTPADKLLRDIQNAAGTK